MVEIVTTKEKPVRRKLYVIAERFEFVQHMLSLRELLLTAKSPVKTQDIIAVEQLQDHMLQVQVREHIEFHGRDYSGVDYDIESSCFYLLLTCIESIVSKPYVQIDDWLVEHWDSLCQDEENAKDCIKGAIDRYRDEHGLRRNFRKALTEGIAPKLMKWFVTHFAVVKTENGELNQDSWNNWCQKQEHEKIAKIASFLYDDVRSRFTHESHRAFLPSVPIKHLPSSKEPVLVRLASEKDNLITLLQEIVVYLVRKHLLELEDDI